MGNKQIWVSPKTGGGWRIHGSNSKRDTIHLQTKEEAIKKAKEIAKNQQNELIIQKRNGVISERNSYGRDPFPPKG